ncbi:hypothetical protein QUF70_03295 [Desulfobacterales bacterium HSG17]|nr:hypothetical protein [Desulfobacterales bacterium HSG17]
MNKFVIIIFITFALLSCSSNTKKQEIKPLYDKSGKPDKSVLTKSPAANSNCYDIGFQWGVCAAKNTEDRSCIPGKDAAITENCLDAPMTQEGIKQGIRSIQRGVQQ